ncbi:MAG TPA: M48 family metallopeptidase [Gemmataceae bacterium]|jgi:Zn-dependent protease with chaperone function|nr:M48 family metallopeptidase [Gemmataceae bacterium]
MATDFFERQDQARRQTGRFVLYFVLGLIALVSLVYLLAAVVFLGGPKSLDDPRRLWDPSLFATTVGGVLVVVTFGCLQKAMQLASGGKAVALLVNGREVLGNTTEASERRLLNVVEEMAIASGVPVPPVYVLPEEGINAFAAGHAPGDSVVAVSQGCLTYLTRDELQGVVAHEFSHMLNGDVLLNLRIVALVFGITALSQIGWVMLQMRSSRSSDKDDNRGGIQLMGLGLYLLGLAGAFFGWLIQAAVSRQREYLADASAVQFTRNPEGIGGALKKIGGLQAGSLVTNPNAGEISHMFLADAFSGHRVTNLFATHPPLAERILRLDPNFDGTFPEVTPIADVPEQPKRRPEARLPDILQGRLKGAALPILASADSATSSVGNTQPYHVIYAAELQTEIPEILRSATQDAFSARALTYGLLLDDRQPIRDAQLAQLQASAEPRDVAATLKLADAVRALADKARLPLLEQAMPALRQMSPRQYQTFAAQVDGLINADRSVSLFEYALRCVLMGYLDSAFNPSRPQERYRAPMQVAPQVATVLSLLAWDGSEETPAQNAFAAGMREFVEGMREFVESDASPLLPRDQCPLRAFDAALQTLKLASPDVKRRVVASCAKCILADSEVSVRESELLRAICATLGCPMPPLVSEAGGRTSV